MKIAIIVVSSSGFKLAKILSEKLKDDPTIFEVDIYQKNVKMNLKNIFNQYNIILGIMATGIMVRNLCSLINNKITDPGILVMDDQGYNVISLLSGHLGGANYYASKISKIISSNAVITTSTDVNGKIGIDELARWFFLEIKNFEKIKTINSALVENKTVKLFVPPNFSFFNKYSIIKNSYSISENNKNNLIIASFKSESLELKPKKLVVGIGSKKDISKFQVCSAIKKALDYLNLPFERIDLISTAEMKKNEEAIINFSADYNIPLDIISLNNLKNFESDEYDDSEFVKEIFGVGGVCQPCALISAGQNSNLILKKIAYNGVTVAVAISM
ncbi:MAG: cobalt-precorrin 5A hydrolase [Methanobacteriaceae archaeon]|nr:cobalt-precorrin 5A hydrolase [Methanobacteriaceae archaeon]